MKNMADSNTPTLRSDPADLITDIFADSKFFSDIPAQISTPTDDHFASLMADDALSSPLFTTESYEPIQYAPPSRRVSIQSIPSLDTATTPKDQMAFGLPVFGFEFEKSRMRREDENHSDFAFLGYNTKQATYDATFLLGDMADLWKLTQTNNKNDNSSIGNKNVGGSQVDGKESLMKAFEDLRSNLVSKVGVMESFARLQSMLVPKKRGVMPILRILQRCLVPKDPAPLDFIAESEEEGVVAQLEELQACLKPMKQGPIAMLEELQGQLVERSESGPVSQLNQLRQVLVEERGVSSVYEELTSVLVPADSKSACMELTKLQNTLSPKQGPVAVLEQMQDQLVPRNGAEQVLNRLQDKLSSKKSVKDVPQAALIGDTRVSNVRARNMKAASSKNQHLPAAVPVLRPVKTNGKRTAPKPGTSKALASIQENLIPKASLMKQMEDLESSVSPRSGPVEQLESLQESLSPKTGAVSQLKELQESLVPITTATAELEKLQSTLVPQTKGPLEILENLNKLLVARETPDSETEIDLTENRSAIEELEQLQATLVVRTKHDLSELHEKISKLEKSVVESRSRRSSLSEVLHLEEELEPVVAETFSKIDRESLDSLRSSFKSDRSLSRCSYQSINSFISSVDGTDSEVGSDGNVDYELIKRLAELQDSLKEMREAIARTQTDRIPAAKPVVKTGGNGIPSARPIGKASAKSIPSPRPLAVTTKPVVVPAVDANPVSVPSVAPKGKKSVEDVPAPTLIIKGAKFTIPAAKSITKSPVGRAAPRATPRGTIVPSSPRKTRIPARSSTPSITSPKRQSVASSPLATEKPITSTTATPSEVSKLSSIPPAQSVAGSTHSSIPSAVSIGSRTRTSSSSKKGVTTPARVPTPPTVTVLPRGFFKVKCRSNTSIASTALKQTDVRKIMEGKRGSNKEVDALVKMFALKLRKPSGKLYWVDEDGDQVRIMHDEDLAVAIRVNIEKSKLDLELK